VSEAQARTSKYWWKMISGCYIDEARTSSITDVALLPKTLPIDDFPMLDMLEVTDPPSGNAAGLSRTAE